LLLIALFSVCVDTINNPLNNQNMNYPLCQGFVFYNKMHPTTYTHKIVADGFEKHLDSKK
jgi:phospholipase/lecithinase/hemolysin